MERRFRLTNDPGGLGLRCTPAGLMLAGVALLHQGKRGFEPRPAAELKALLDQAYPGLDRDIEPGLEVVAQALNAGDLTKAMIAAVFLRLSPLDPETAARLAKQYDAAEARDAKGKWTVGGLLAASQRPIGVDTRQLAAQLAQSQREVSPAAFQSLQQGVEARLSRADRQRLAQDRELEAKIDGLTRPYYSSALAQQAAAESIRIQQTGRDMLTVPALVHALHAIHAARIAPGATREDRDHLLPLWFAVYTRGSNQYDPKTGMPLLSPDFRNPEMREEAMLAIAYDGTNGFANLRGIGTAREIPLETPNIAPTKTKITPVRPHEATVGASQNGDYRDAYLDIYVEAGSDIDIHHAIPQYVLKKWPGLFTVSEIHSLQNLRGIPREIVNLIHYRKLHGTEWNAFYKAFKDTPPTRQQVLDFATKMDWKYGEFFTPAIRKLLQNLSTRLDALRKTLRRTQPHLDVAFG